MHLGDTMYKYCREIMWSAEDNAFIATVVELAGCKADGKTVVEAVNNLDTIIEEWIETAKEMGRAIPNPLYYEQADINDVPEDERTPHYDSLSRTWKVVTEWGKEEGDALYIASEFVKGGLIYPFHSQPPEKEQHHNHTHAFSSVVEFLLKKPYYFSIDGFEDYYSQQERKLLENLKIKLHIPNAETLAAIEDVENGRNLSNEYTDVDELMRDLLEESEE